MNLSCPWDSAKRLTGVGKVNYLIYRYLFTFLINKLPNFDIIYTIKLLPFKGPFRIKQCVNDVSFILDLKRKKGGLNHVVTM